DGVVVASAGAFHLASTNTGSGPRRPETVVYDYGAACVAPSFGGLKPYTLQDILFWLRTLSLTLTNFKAPGGICLLVSVAAENAASLSSIQRNSFDEIQTIPKWLDDVSKTWLSGPARHFWLDSPGVLQQAKKFVEAIQRITVLSRVERDTGRTRNVHLDLDIDWFNKAFSVITEIVRGEISLSSCKFSAIPQDATLTQ